MVTLSSLIDHCDFVCLAINVSIFTFLIFFTFDDRICLVFLVAH